MYSLYCTTADYEMMTLMQCLIFRAKTFRDPLNKYKWVLYIKLLERHAKDAPAHAQMAYTNQFG